MQTELNLLENKLAQLVQLTQRLRTENHQLRQELATALSQDRQSNDKIESARARLERLLAQIPEEET
jgi:cell division protein ZapB